MQLTVDMKGLLGKSAGDTLLIGLLMLLGVATIFAFRFALGLRYIGAVVAAYLLFTSAVLVTWPRHPPQLKFGIANGVTLLRAIGVCLIVGTLALDTLRPQLVWMVAGIAGCNLLLDGCDGRLARHYGITSAFGARFDMDVDALLIMVLCVVLVVHYDMAVWVLAIGLLRYFFEGAGLLRPWLRAPLTTSTRGRVIGSYQICTLIVALVSRPTIVREILLVSALLLLIYSFTIDIWSLYRRATHALPALSSNR
ncbi:MAG TPA: CDP-alcohol phosphatidyltransferase family protein [Methanomicrobia archaeon]|nr:CDP-alcohol phosphatidyltransferase family protein [Methanomicrobia archaeon]